MSINRKSLCGFTLIELMIGMLVGLIVIGGVTTVYISTLTSSSENLKFSKLNQELGSMMSVMSNDITRAGIWGTPDFAAPQDNPFAQDSDTALVIRNSVAGNALVSMTSSTGGSCILYSYDADLLGTLDNTDIRGFRLNNNVVEMRQNGTATATAHNSCNDTTNDTWVEATEGRLIKITTLTFAFASASTTDAFPDSECINTREPNGVNDDGLGGIDDPIEMDCYAQVPTNGSGDITTETRQVYITITGELVNDSSVTSTVRQSVRVRNDLIRVR